MVILDDDGSAFIVYVKKAGQFTDINEKESGKMTAGKHFINFAKVSL